MYGLRFEKRALHNLNKLNKQIKKRREIEMKFLDIGCGAKKVEVEGAKVIGLDFYDKTQADVICNLEEGKLPFEDNEFDGIYSRHTLEHIKNLVPIIDEMWRVVKPGGVIKIWTPYFASSLAHSTIEHVRFFAYTSFYPYREEDPTHYLWKPTTFKVKSQYNFSKQFGLRTIGKVIGFIINKIPRIYQRLFCFILPTEEIYYELEVVKEIKNDA
jgi:ubiquinone/menaquinone biosynthesis C-methylase UbiE